MSTSIVSCFMVVFSNAYSYIFFFFFQAEDGIRDADVTGVQTCALPILKLATGFDPTSAVIDSYLGNDFVVKHEIPEFYYADNFIYTKQGTFSEILGFEN